MFSIDKGARSRREISARSDQTRDGSICTSGSFSKRSSAFSFQAYSSFVMPRRLQLFIGQAQLPPATGRRSGGNMKVGRLWSGYRVHADHTDDSTAVASAVSRAAGWASQSDEEVGDKTLK